MVQGRRLSGMKRVEEVKLDMEEIEPTDTVRTEVEEAVDFARNPLPRIFSSASSSSVSPTSLPTFSPSPELKYPSSTTNLSTSYSSPLCLESPLSLRAKSCAALNSMFSWVRGWDSEEVTEEVESRLLLLLRLLREAVSLMRICNIHPYIASHPM